MLRKLKKDLLFFLSLCLLYLVLSLPLSFAVQISYSYDANGNLIQDESSYYEYNGFDQLTRVRLGNSSGTILSEYFYDHNGNRILTIDYNGSANTSTYYPSDSFVQVVNHSGSYNTTYYYAGNILLAADNGSIAYYHPDHLGSTTLVTDGAGALLRETRYGPFGAVLSGGNDRYLYTGQEFDSETDLYYYGARFYKPAYYHFTQPDRIIQAVYDPQFLNRYAYVRNNPYKYIDPDGSQASSAEGDFEYGFGYVTLVSKLWKRYEASQELERRLREESDAEPQPTCLGCSVSTTSFRELQEKDLKKNLDIKINDEGDVIGYKYQGFETTKAGLKDMGFTGAPIYKITKEKVSIQREKLGIEEKKSIWNKFFNAIIEKIRQNKETDGGNKNENN